MDSTGKKENSADVVIMAEKNYSLHSGKRQLKLISNDFFFNSWDSILMFLFSTASFNDTVDLHY